MRSFRWIFKQITLIDLDILLRSEQICKKCTILGKLRTVTQEWKRKLDKRPHFFHLRFELKQFVIFIFVFENFQNSFLWVPRFAPFWSAKHLNFGGESRVVRILSRSIQETYRLTKVKNQVLLFSIELRTKFVWSHGVQNVKIYFLFYSVKILRYVTFLSKLDFHQFQRIDRHPTGIVLVISTEENWTNLIKHICKRLFIIHFHSTMKN